MLFFLLHLLFAAQSGALPPWRATVTPVVGEVPGPPAAESPFLQDCARILAVSDPVWLYPLHLARERFLGKQAPGPQQVRESFQAYYRAISALGPDPGIIPGWMLHHWGKRMLEGVSVSPFRGGIALRKFWLLQRDSARIHRRFLALASFPQALELQGLPLPPEKIFLPVQRGVEIQWISLRELSDRFRAFFAQGFPSEMFLELVLPPALFEVLPSDFGADFQAFLHSTGLFREPLPPTAPRKTGFRAKESFPFSDQMVRWFQEWVYLHEEVRPTLPDLHLFALSWMQGLEIPLPPYFSAFHATWKEGKVDQFPHDSALLLEGLNTVFRSFGKSWDGSARHFAEMVQELGYSRLAGDRRISTARRYLGLLKPWTF